MAVELQAPPPAPGRLRAPDWLRRNTDLSLAVAMGCIVGLLIFTLPMQAALATAVVGAFVLTMLVDTRVALLTLLVVRASVDVFATVPLLGSSDGINPNALMSLLVIVLGVAHIAMNRLALRRIPLVTPFAVFVAVTLLGVAVAPNKAEAMEDWLRIISAFLIYVMVVDLMRTERDSRWLVRIIVLSSVIPLTVGMYQFFSGTGDSSTEGLNRVLATFVHPSPYAFYLVQIFPLALVLFIHAQSRLARVALGAMIPLMAFSIYATQTRGAWIGLVVMVAVFMWFRARWSLILIPVVLAAAYVGDPGVRSRIAEATAGECESATYCQSSVLWRTKQWQAASDIASLPELATFGAGQRSVYVELGEFTHNEYVRLIVETGLIGFSAIIVLYVGLFNITWRGFRDAETPFKQDLMLAFMMAFAARVVMSGADNILVITVLEWYFWAFAAVIVVESGAYDRFAHIQDDRRRMLRSPSSARPTVVSDVPAS